MTNEQEIRSEALEQATRVVICNSKRRTGSLATAEEVMRLADKFSDYIKTGDHQ